MKRFLIHLLIAALVCFCLPAAAAGNPMAFDTGASVVFEGETLQTVLTREGESAEGEVTYASSDTRVATVNEAGVVTGVLKGKATITATVKTEKQTYRARLNLTVARKVTELTVDTGKLSVFQATDEKVAGLLSKRENAEENELPVILLPVKKNITVKATLQPRDATNRNITVTADEGAPFSVKKTTVTATEPGEGILTVASEQNPEIAQRFRVLVIQPVTRLTATASAPSVAAGEQLTLSAQAIPENATIQAVTWKSENEKIASVTPDGVVTAHAKGNARMVATAQDGSNVRVNINVKVTQKAEQITFKADDVTVDAGKKIQLTATVLPKNTDDKSVVWSSSDESIATVDARGRVSAISLGTCEITCASASVPEVKAAATVHVQQPVTAITLNGPYEVWMGENQTMTWTVEPANASNPALKLETGNRKILTIDENGVMTPVKTGETTVTATSTDGSHRRARVKVKVLQHVEGVHMLRHTAYIDPKETSTAGAILEPKNASNHNMSWSSDNTDIATVSGTSNRVKITGRNKGTTTVTGVTEDGGFSCSITVKIGNWEKSLKITNAGERGGDIYLTVLNQSDLNITKITAEVTTYDPDGNVIPSGKKGNTFKLVYNHTLSPGAKTKENGWKVVDFKDPESPAVVEFEVRITEFEIDHDWVKLIRKNNQPKKNIPVHL